MNWKRLSICPFAVRGVLFEMSDEASLEPTRKTAAVAVEVAIAIIVNIRRVLRPMMVN